MPLKTIDVNDSLGKCLRRFLRQVMPDAAVKIPVRILAREFLGVSARIRMWSPIGVPFESDGRHGYKRAFGKSLFQFVIFLLAFRQTKPPAVIVDHDGDVIRIIERRCAEIERGVIEVPLRRG